MLPHNRAAWGCQCRGAPVRRNTVAADRGRCDRVHPAVKRSPAGWGLGAVSRAERRQADLFLADLLGRVRRRAERGEEQDVGAFGEDAPVSLQMRGGGAVGNSTTATNVREDVLNALDRLQVLWSITNANYGREYPRIAALSAGVRVSNPDVNLAQLVAAVRQNEGAQLHDRVMRNCFEIDVGAPVGAGQPNRTADVRKLQAVLVAHGILDPGALTEGDRLGRRGDRRRLDAEDARRHSPSQEADCWRAARLGSDSRRRARVGRRPLRQPHMPLVEPVDLRAEECFERP